MKRVKAKKYLGQHFLNDQHIAMQIVEALPIPPYKVLEIGPGMGVLTEHLSQKNEIDLSLVELDAESVAYLTTHYPQLSDKIIAADFLKMDLSLFFEGEFSIIGNFPYNISSQIFFKVLEHRDQVKSVTGMVQREVGRRLTSGPGNKEYGILSVFMQAWYNAEYLFTVDEHVFSPPPKVKSAVIRFTRNDVTDLGCDPGLFHKVVKTAFNQRRKTMRNSLKTFGISDDSEDVKALLQKRPEQLGVEEFVKLTNIVGASM
ncbi:16S rRNA (adenine(1518)-N(6)/adenine(1519)-N(6))-dimethyltransferase RsmA [Marinilabilia rubra]|uniref:Ribosomal RNA small subunit methyltransferase A n=1 Tax=Marinilabilia rubra TaxID=2162893 RepID=A0A2U2BDG1_9BACT|nr:16S rRNA (adenine(1518)-N(6)/adenine(1519)-N(6))-dimethyltransferase RsmA [Marinilabilia rubra]PWE01067.1 16S rRNA (adenine(1518)-N(6)/adenine(1519)-N(6))-dimethyltransferase [Marinilabilia rubra]